MFGSNNIGAAGATSVAAALKNVTGLCCLDLRGFFFHVDVFTVVGNCIGPDGASAIAEVLSKNTRLTSLCLESNWFGARGATALARSLSKSTGLVELEFGNNDIGPDGCVAIREEMVLCTSMTKVSLWGEHSFSVRFTMQETRLDLMVWQRFLPCSVAALDCFRWIYERIALGVLVRMRLENY